MKSDQVLIGGAGILLLAFLIWGYRKHVGGSVGISGPGNSTVLMAPSIKPASVYRYSPPVQNVAMRQDKSPSGCGCLFPW